MNRQTINILKDALRKGVKMKDIEIDERPKVIKEGYKLVPLVLDENHIAWEFVKDESTKLGTYENPIKYISGDAVEVGKWYYLNDKDLPHEAVQSGYPNGFYDKGFFDYVE